MEQGETIVVTAVWHLPPLKLIDLRGDSREKLHLYCIATSSKQFSEEEKL